jgi:hypothetical protein
MILVSSILSITGTPSNGSLPIGNGQGFTVNTLTAGANVTITNGPGTITIAATSSGGTPAGASNEIQYNNSGAFGANSNLAWDIANSRAIVGTEAVASTNSRLVVIGKGTSTNQTFAVHNSTGINNSLVVRDNGLIGIGTNAPAARLDIRAQGALSTDIAFRVRNSADTADLTTIDGLGKLTLQYNGNSSIINISGTTTGGATNRVAIGGNASDFNATVVGISSTAGDSGVAIGQGAAGNIDGVGIGRSALSANFSVAIGRSASATGIGSIAIGNTSSASADRSLAIGNNTIASADPSIAIGHRTRATAIRAIAIGTSNDNVSQFINSIADSFQVGFNALQSFFINTNSNLVLKTQTSLTSGTHFEAAATNTFTIHNGTAPVANIADATAFYSADIVAGNAAPHFRTENGNIIKIYRETTGIAAAAFVSNTSLIVDDSATYGGYTMGQVVAALKAQGLLA